MLQPACLEGGFVVAEVIEALEGLVRSPGYRAGKAVYGLARMYQVLGASPNLMVEIFTEHEGAEAWLAEAHDR